MPKGIYLHNNSGKNNPFYGKKHSDKTKEIISLAKMGQPSPTKGMFREKSSMWKGGVTKINGYVLNQVPTHPHQCKGKYVLKHRLVAEKCLGRYLRPEEIIIHINKNREDNRPENLFILENRSELIRYINLKDKSDYSTSNIC